MRVLTSGIPSPVIGSQGPMSEDVMLESTTSEVGVVLKGHDDDDKDSS